MEKEIAVVGEHRVNVDDGVEAGRDGRGDGGGAGEGGDGEDDGNNGVKKADGEVVKEAEGEVTEKATETEAGRTKRVASLDAFRGLTIVVMILVDDSGGSYERIDHSPWNGCTLADFVMPFFLFIVGVSIALAFKRISRVPDAIRKIVVRTIKLLFWGILLQGGYSHAPDDLSYGVDMKKIRWCGILQRIALAYLVVALVEVFTYKSRPRELGSNPFAIFRGYRWQWLAGFIAFSIYMCTTFALYVPDWSFVYNAGDTDGEKRFTVKCGKRGQLGPACNAVGYVDREVWGINHLYSTPVWIRSKACTYSSPASGPLRADAPPWCFAPFEPEGLLSSISAILSATIGIHYGHVLIHYKVHSERLKHWMLTAIVLLISGLLLHFTNAIPINKQLYSVSYVCFTAGAAGMVLSFFYLLIDVYHLGIPFLFLEYIGMNSMLIFVLGASAILPAFVNGWYYENPGNTLVYWIQKHIFMKVWHYKRIGTLLYVIFGEILFYAVLAAICHKLGFYWKL
ncbi:hypothetical protein KFK09_022540 [Dendrobium nobile]|uniref:Heparan-alpha-glucosaminide N-acetyltransferase catalytic domain-containing protein n=1 Tax=Dendrobium nobile TaxID=94219 RepID=A0A8T3AIU6_DENNO|nr:hypothetical protein KFK09_022540 [Dendrobium nobile]